MGKVSARSAASGVALVALSLASGCSRSDASGMTATDSDSAVVIDTAPPVTAPNVDDGSGYVVDGPLVMTPECPLPEPNGCDPGDALLEGVLRFDASCAFVEGDGWRYAMLWDHGVSWDEAQQVLITSDGELMRSGDAIASGGGEGTPANLALIYSDAVLPSALEDCASQPGTSGFWIGYASPIADGARSTRRAPLPNRRSRPPVERASRPPTVICPRGPRRAGYCSNDAGRAVGQRGDRRLPVRPTTVRRCATGRPESEGAVVCADDVEELTITMSLEGDVIETTRRLNGTCTQLPRLPRGRPCRLLEHLDRTRRNAVDTLSLLFVSA